MPSMEKPNIFDESPEFSLQINPVSLAFKDKQTEKEFYKYKYETKNLLLAIGIDIIFNMSILGLRAVSVYFKGLNELFPTSFPIIFLILQMALWNVALVIEIPLFFLPKFHLLRGFFLTSLPMAGASILTIYYCSYTYKTNGPMFTSLVYFAAIESVIIALVYSANWICGALQITILCLISSVSFALMPGNTILDRPFSIIINVSVSIGIVLTLYYFEYFQRKAIFMKVEAERQKNNLKMILDRLPEPILITVQKEIQYSNNAYSKISSKDTSEFSSESEEMKSKTSSEVNITNTQIININQQQSEFLFKLKQEKTEKTFKEAIENGDQFHKEHFNLKIREDTRYHFEITTLEIVFGQKNTILYLLKNLTAFNKIKTLQEREKYQRVYFASITHDFRTPIGIISGNSEILLDLTNDPYQKTQIINIHHASSILLLLVQDILDYAQMKAGTLQIAPSEVIIEKEFSTLVELFLQKYQDKGLTLALHINVNVPKTIYNDGNRIKQILMNLISNSYKFTKKGGVEINVDFNEEERKIIVYVKDTGVGMEPSEASTLFREYGKLSRHKDLNPMGIGLGLNICKQLVAKLGGIISAESQVDVGTTFKFSVSSNLILEEKKLIEVTNLANESQDQISSNRVIEGEIITNQLSSSNTKSLSFLKEKKFCKCPKLLIVDDDPGIRMILKHYATTMLISFEEAENGSIALQKVKNKMNSNCCQFFSLILTDYYMPEMDGVQSSIQIKNFLLDYHNNPTKIVLVSGLSKDERDSICGLPNMPFEMIESKPLPKNRFKVIVNKFIL